MPDSDSRSSAGSPRRPACDAILWDMDGTLSDSEPVHQASLVAALRHFGVAPHDTLHADTFGMTGRASYQYCVERYGRAFDFVLWSQVRSDTFAASLATLRARSGAPELCRAAARAGVRQAVVSNAGRGTLDAGIAALGLDAYFETTVSAHDVTEGKPAPDGYLLAARRLGVAPADAVVVEDSPLGAAAGVAAGMRVLAWLGAHADASAYPAQARIVRSSKQLAEALGLALAPGDAA